MKGNQISLVAVERLCPPEKSAAGMVGHLGFMVEPWRQGATAGRDRRMSESETLRFEGKVIGRWFCRQPPVHKTNSKASFIPTDLWTSAKMTMTKRIVNATRIASQTQELEFFFTWSSKVQ